MSLHDAYARVTPFEIAFPHEEAAERLVAEVLQESSSRAVDPQLPGVFHTLGTVADFVSELQAPDAPAEAAHELEALLFQVVHFHRAGRPVYLIDAAATRYLVGGAPGGDPTPPTSSGYLQLPQHLFWMGAATEGRAPESVDGVFWFASDAGSLRALAITGVLPDRMTFRAVPVPGAPLGDAVRWLDVAVRDSGDDYASTLPGHDLDTLYSVETAGEVLKLLVRFFAYLQAAPEAVERRGCEDDEGARPRPSRLPHARVRLVA